MSMCMSVYTYVFRCIYTLRKLLRVPIFQISIWSTLRNWMAKISVLYLGSQTAYYKHQEIKKRSHLGGKILHNILFLIFMGLY